jgi:crossover junction endodeoxyribonuclease RusA
VSEVEFTVPFAPSVNHYWISCVSKGRVLKFVGPKGKKFRADVLEITKDLPKFPPDASLSMKMVIRPPDRRKRDVDNFSKALLDALEAAQLFDNDCQIDELHIKRDKNDIIKDGEIQVFIKSL